MLKRLLRALLRLHLRHPRPLGLALTIATLVLGWGAFRVERQLDLMGLLPRAHPVIQNSLRAGSGSEELLWLAAEGDDHDLAARKRWMERLAERLFTDEVPINGLTREGALAAPVSVPGPDGVALWPPLLAAGALASGDEAALQALGTRAYTLAPFLAGSALEASLQPEALRKALDRSVADLRGLDPLRARLAILDPFRLREGIAFPKTLLGKGLNLPPFRIGPGTLTSRDGRWVLLPVVLRFPTGQARRTEAVVAWLARGGQGPLSDRASLPTMEQALAPGGDRAFALQVTGAHAIAAWESGHLTREIAGSLLLSFLLIGLVYALGFRTLAGFGFIAAPLLLGMVWALGALGLLLGSLNLMVAVFAAVILGVGDDAGILLLSRYLDARRLGSGKALALKVMLIGTGPGVLAGGLTLAAAFLAFAAAPIPALRELGLSVGLGFLVCLAAMFLVMPALLIALDRGGIVHRHKPIPSKRPAPRWRFGLGLLVVLLAALGASRLHWQQDLRAFRRAENPAMALQERLAKAAGTGLQFLALHLDLKDPQAVPSNWNRAAAQIQQEGLPFPDWPTPSPELRALVGSAAWRDEALHCAASLGLASDIIQRRLQALATGIQEPLLALGTFSIADSTALQIPLRLPEEAQDRVQAGLGGHGAMLVGTRPMGMALKDLAKAGLWRAAGAALLAMTLVVATFGRRLRFGLFVAMPILASLAGSLGALGWADVPLGFLSLGALPIAMGVGADLTLNMLHRARLDASAPANLGRVSAVCAGTTLAGFGGLLFCGHAGLRSLGLAAFGGTALALLTVQWILPPLLQRWPLLRTGSESVS